MHRLRVARIATIIGAFVLTFAEPRVSRSADTSTAAATAASSSLKDATWGDATRSRYTPNVKTRTKSAIVDHFGPTAFSYATFWKTAVAANGTRLETAGSGSDWVYDSVHHIAATSEGGDVTGDAIFYSNPPPFRIIARDLSHVVSALGLRLGISIARATSILHLRSTDVRMLSKRDAVLALGKDIPCGKTTCGAHETTVYFRDGKSIAISLLTVGP